MTPEQLKRFDEASNHPYECKCELCKEWWWLVPPEDDDDYAADGDDEEAYEGSPLPSAEGEGQS